MNKSQKFSHIFLNHSYQTSEFASPPGGGEFRLPQRDRLQHQNKLRKELEQAWTQVNKNLRNRSAVSLPVKDGAYLEFESSLGFGLVTKQLEDKRVGIRLLNIRTVRENGESKSIATVYVPNRSKGHFLKKIRQYAEEENSKSKNPRHSKLINSIESIQLALLESFWQDDPSLIPTPSEKRWLEVWLRGNTDETVAEFLKVAEALQMDVQDEVLYFPERIVLLINAHKGQLIDLIEFSEHIAEFRRAKETARFFLELPNKDQSDWVESLVERLSVMSNPRVAVTILDTGVNNGHPLLEPLLDDNDLHSVNPAWGKSDHHGHGTWMSGIIAFGDLQKALESHDVIEVRHCLESAKILPPNDFEPNKPRLYGHITEQGIRRVEVQAPDRIHIVCMPICSVDGRDKGRPSSWSAYIDQLSFGVNADDQKRLFIIPAGNVDDPEEWKSYPASNLESSIQDPGQSWNAITVGAFTEKATITDVRLNGYVPTAKSGSLSPFSSTSLIWEQKRWPNKPDIVLEGGNTAKDLSGFVGDNDDLSLITTGHAPQSSQLNLFNMTSAATAQAAWMAAKIQSTYLSAWPETVRGLLVHSAEWTQTMKDDFLDSDLKTDYAKLLRICGYGVPNLDRALACFNNSLTLIAQEEIQPYKKPKGGATMTKDMHLHELPWPKQVLLDLGEVEVALRITLSYFVEPSPGEVGWKDKYRYPSYALRFDLNNVNESQEQFLKRINVKARNEKEKPDSKSGSERWTIGSNGRDLGSIHSDIWTGTAADLATCNLIGVHPIIGWWRERPWLGKWGNKARYSLIVSIDAPNVEVDIYTPVLNQVNVPIEIYG
ncbi:MAG: hypothetical protein ACI85F_002990 [Bacteroidia bacterium]|jgi:hypothetical protein